MIYALENRKNLFYRGRANQTPQFVIFDLVESRNGVNNFFHLEHLNLFLSFFGRDGEAYSGGATKSVIRKAKDRGK